MRILNALLLLFWEYFFPEKEVVSICLYCGAEVAEKENCADCGVNLTTENVWVSVTVCRLRMEA